MANEVKMCNPPAYVISSMPPADTDEVPRRYSRQSKMLFGYAVAITTALVVVVVMGAVFYSRSLDVLQTSLKKYSSVDNSGDVAVKEDIEIDTVNNVVVFRLSGDGIAPGTFAVLDYPKSITAIYDPRAQSCYLIPGIDSRIISPAALNDNLAKNLTAPTTVETLNYKQSSSYPISNKDVLPAPLKSACAVLPIYWMEKEEKYDTSRNTRDLCVKPCPRIFGVRICARICIG